jgi:hypothetical protein
MKGKPVEPLPQAEIIRLASLALGKVDLHGLRGVTMLSVQETEAVALLLTSMGLVPTRPGDAAPAAYFILPEGETK